MIAKKSNKAFDIAVDMDGVICDLVKDVLSIIKRKYGLSLKKSDIYKHEMHEILGLPKKDFSGVFGESLVSLKHPIIKNAPYYINKLSKTHRISIVTSRPKQSNSVTRKWLDLNKINYDRIINIENSKFSILRGFNFFIDDHLSEIICAGSINDLKLILFDQPWNKSYNMQGLFKRVKTWREIYFLITK